MTRRLAHLPGRAALAVLVLLAILPATVASAAPPHRTSGADTVDAIAGELIVRWAAGSTGAQRAAARAAHGLQRAHGLGDAAVELVRLPRVADLPTRAAQLSRHPNVAYAVPNEILQVAAEPYSTELWGLDNTGQVIGGRAGVPDVDIDGAESRTITAGTASTIVAVVDSGVDITHPDLAANIWVNTAEANGLPGVDDDGNGYVDDRNGWDFLSGDATVYDDPWIDAHGTHVAGTIAAVENGVGVVGVAPGVTIMPLKFIGPDGGTTANAVRAIHYAARNGARVVNASWGGGADSPALRDAIASTGVAFVAAAGNGGSDQVGDDLDAAPTYPAAYDLPNLVSVASIDNRGALSPFSNYGASTVDVGAPGASVLSTVPGGYGYKSGTSMAAPHVAGIAALVASQRPAASGAEVVAAVTTSAEPLASLAGNTSTGGLVNAHRALRTLAPPGAPTDVSASAGASSATVAWSAPSDDGGSPITAYTVTASPGGASATTGATARSVEVAGLTPGTSYTFTVRATNEIGTGPASVPSAPVTPTSATTGSTGPTTDGSTPGGSTSGGATGGATSGGTTSGDAPTADAPTTSSACPDDVTSAGFADVGPGNVHRTAIDCVTWWEVASGTSATTYAPGARVTRGQMARFLAQVLVAAGFPLDTTGDHFDDDDASPHRDAIEALAAAGIVDGVAPGQYAPAGEVTRAQMAAYLVRTYEYVGERRLSPGRDHFSDDRGTFHEPSINIAADLGLATGRTATTYDPAGAVRRDQMASFLERLLDVLAVEGRLGDGAVS